MLCVKMTALDMHDSEDLDPEFQMRYRGEDISTVPCFIADFGRVRFSAVHCFFYYAGVASS